MPGATVALVVALLVVLSFPFGLDLERPTVGGMVKYYLVLFGSHHINVPKANCGCESLVRDHIHVFLDSPDLDFTLDRPLEPDLVPAAKAIAVSRPLLREQVAVQQFLRSIPTPRPPPFMDA